MASKGNSRHVNRLAASKYLKISRKASQFVAKPAAGRFTGDRTIALITLLKERLDVAQNSREARKIIKTGRVEINGKKIRDEKFPIGLGDVIKFSDGSAYRIGVSAGGFAKVEKLDKAEAQKVTKVVGKYVSNGRQIMLRVLDGMTIKGDNKVRVNDSVVLKDGKVSSVLKFEKGAQCLVIKGTHSAESGTIKDISNGTATRDSTVRVAAKNGEEFETLTDNVMVVGA